jgi:hypothetical protein
MTHDAVQQQEGGLMYQIEGIGYSSEKSQN